MLEERNIKCLILSLEASKAFSRVLKL